MKEFHDVITEWDDPAIDGLEEEDMGMVGDLRIGEYNLAIVSKVLGILEDEAPLGSGTWDFNGANGDEIDKVFTRWRLVRADTALGRRTRLAREKRRKRRPAA